MPASAGGAPVSGPPPSNPGLPLDDPLDDPLEEPPDEPLVEPPEEPLVDPLDAPLVDPLDVPNSFASAPRPASGPPSPNPALLEPLQAAMTKPRAE
jgi:hypothetical protein